MNMNIKWIIPLAIITLILIFQLRPAQAVLLTPVDFLHCENEWYNVTANKNFNVLKIAATYVVFNTTGFNLSSVRNVYVYLDYLKANPLVTPDNIYILKYYENTSAPGRIWFNISGFVIHDFYNITKDGVLLSSNKSNATGSLSWSETVTGKHYYQIYPLVNSTTLSVTTNATSTIRERNATFHGFLNDQGGANCTTGFEYGTSTAYGSSILSDGDYVYAAGGTIDKVYKYWKSNMTKISETAVYPGNILSLAQDSNYIYFGGDGVINEILQCWKANMTLKDHSAAFGNEPRALVSDGTYVFASKTAPQTIRQYFVSNMTYSSQTAVYGAIIYALTEDPTFIYAGGGAPTVRVRQYWKSNLTYRAQAPVYGDVVFSTILALADDEQYVYATGINGSGVGTVERYWKTNMTKKDATFHPLSAEIWSLAVDDAYIYSGGPDITLHQYYKSNMTLKTSTVASYGGHIFSLSGDGLYVYAGGDVTQKVNQYYKSNLTLKAQSANYGGTIYGVSAFPGFGSRDTFSANVTGLSPGTLYHVRAFASNIYAGGYGLDTTFITKPSTPTALTSQSNYSGQIYLTWTKGTGANNTVIRRRTGYYPTGPADGTLAYNGTGTKFADAGLTPGLPYFYRAYSWTKLDGLNNFSDGSASTNYIAKPGNATAVTAVWVPHGFNITWTLGTGRNKSVLVFNAHRWPNSISNGSIIYNGTHACYIDNNIGHCNGSVGYYRVFSYSSWVNPTYGTFTGTSVKNESKKLIYSNQTVYPLNTTNKQETTATLSGIYYGGTNAICGWWIGTSLPVTGLSWIFNITAPGTYDLNDTYSASVPGLVSAQYYYVKPWYYNSSIGVEHFDNSTTMEYVLTKPNPPSALTITSPSGVCTVKWTNASIPASTPINTTVVRYQMGSPPTNVTEGLGVNVTSNHTKIPGLFGTWYFSLWHYIKDSGSPTYHWYSDTYVWTMATLEGGVYNLTIRYENTTYRPINLSKGDNHTLIVHYNNKTEYNRFIGRTWRYRESVFDASDPHNGTLSLNCSQSPIFFEFHWNDTRNDSTTHAYSCSRIIVPIANQYNRSIYVLIDKMVYGDYAPTINNSLVRYTYSFQDKAGIFTSKLNMDSYASIYTFDMSNTKLIIHEEFLDSTAQIYPWLLYEKKYFIGVACSIAAIERIGVAPTSSSLNPQVVIPLLTEHYYSLNEIIIVTFGWNHPAPGCWVRYQDTVFKTKNVTLRVYNMSTGALVYWHNVSNFVFNFSCPVGNPHQTYNFMLSINHTYWALNQTITGVLYPYIYSLNASYLNYILNLTFGKTPIRNDITGQELPWIYILIGAVAFFILLSFSTINAFGAVAGAGLWLVFAGTLFHSLPEVGLLGAGSLIVGGFFMVILAIIAAMGGYGR